MSKTQKPTIKGHPRHRRRRRLIAGRLYWYNSPVYGKTIVKLLNVYPGSRYVENVRTGNRYDISYASTLRPAIDPNDVLKDML